MIEVKKCDDKQTVKDMFLKLGFLFNKKSGCVFAKCKDEELGFCLYELDEKGVCILYLEPEEDIMLADGILRSTLHVAAERSAMNAVYGERVSEKLLKTLDFIKDEEKKTLNIDKLFGGCCCKNG